ncbi:metabotropic glutamate receptor 3-like [Hydractinia symbiolongicarpus]|uniref:metabotropic glutamate receptor 3-like n=1 Tax=Hydractinia symbiolongicarpus TaxID=13093 RepID=UPI00254CA3B0|nr:metabotropic glutamate receptor 3-like [Hydractinia symbiolongicarpus]
MQRLLFLLFRVRIMYRHLLTLFFFSHVPLKVACEILRGSGTFRLNGIFPIKYGKRINYQSGIMMAEAMRYAVEKINNETDFLSGYKLGIYRVIDMGMRRKIRMSVLSTFMGHIPFLIGPHTSETSYITSILTGTFRQVVVSYGATYSDFDKTGTAYGHMVRTVPSDRFRIQVVLDVIGSLKWNYIALINSYGYDGEREARNFISKLSTINVCLAELIDLPSEPKLKHYMDAILSLNLDQRLKAVVLFTTIDDSRFLLETILKLKLGGRFYLLCAYGCTNYIEVVKGYEETALGTLSIDLHHPENIEFKKYFLSQNPWNNPQRYFKLFWENLFNCTLNNKIKSRKRFCSRSSKLGVGHGYYPITPVHTVIDAVNSVGKAVRSLLQLFCRQENKRSVENKTWCNINATKRDIYSYTVFTILKQMAYIDGTINTKKSQYVQYDVHSFNNVNGAYKNILIGTWKIKRNTMLKYAQDVLRKRMANFTMFDKAVSVRNGTETQPLAICSVPCPITHIRVKDANPLKARCCWTCKICPVNSISLNDTCKSCQKTEMADHTRKKCILLPEHFINAKSPLSLLFLLLTTAGLCLTVVIVVLFVRFNNHYVIRSSGRDLCYMILLGIGLTFACPLTYLTKPTVASCTFRGTLPGLAFLKCYAPLFLKTNRIYRIFRNAKTSISRPSLISPQSQLFLLLGIVFIQLLLAGVWFASKMPAPSQVVSDKSLITLHCKGDTSSILLLLNLALSVIFMIACTILAFKTRHFPKNYNEAKFIGITLYITCVTWSIFLPTYFLATGQEEAFIKEYLMCGVCIVNGYVTLVGLFGQKIKILFSPTLPELNTKPQMLSLSYSKHLHIEREISSAQDYKIDENMLTPPLRKSTTIMTNGNTGQLKIANS